MNDMVVLIVTIIGTGITVIGTGIAVAAFMYTFLRDFKENFNKKIDDLDKDMNSKIDSVNASVNTKIDTLGAKVDADMKAQTSRTDQLYQMFIDLLQAQKPRTDP